MLNALNALSEDGSLLQMPPWVNPWLILAIIGSLALHCVILYIPVFNKIFGILPLTGAEWILVFAFSIPVLFVDELLKVYSRARNRAMYGKAKKED
jgi:Ca2+-transporting ATPase